MNRQKVWRNFLKFFVFMGTLIGIATIFTGIALTMDKKTSIQLLGYSIIIVGLTLGTVSLIGDHKLEKENK